MPLISKYQELFINLSVRILISRTRYVGESKRSWDSRGKEHNPGRRTNNESAIKHHVQTTGHDIHLKNATILERGILNYERRVFLESWHSTLDKGAINERKEFPKNYTPMLKS